jgi:hypothetical protein
VRAAVHPDFMVFMRSTRLFVVLTAGAALAACKDSTPPAGIGPPAKIEIVSGGSQSALANTAIPLPITVAVKDAAGHLLDGKTVTMAVVAGGGSITPTNATTDANGQVTLATWTLGKSASAQQVRFTADTAHLAVAASVQTAYNIVVRFWGNPMTAAQQALFTNAAQRIEGIVTGDVEDADARGQNIPLDTACNVSGQPKLNELIDDVIIYASIQPIDGPGTILAQSGPCLIRNDPNTPPFPAVGIMEFDSADLATITAGGSLQDVITHEMMHVLGFGVIWNIAPLSLLDSTDQSNPRFLGTQARLGCVALGGTSSCSSSVPVEGTPAPKGTADSHWRESVFDSEIMTGYIDANNPISKMTIGSFADMGYTVNNADNDSYSLASLRAAATPSSSRLRNWDRVLQPTWAINPVTGHVRQLRLK